MVDRWGESILRDTCVTSDIAVPRDKNLSDTHNKVAETLRRSPYYATLTPMEVEDMSLHPRCNVHPILFEQRYSSAPKPNFTHRDHRAYRGVHLLVLVHGFQGNSFDMRLMKNNIATLFPDSLFLCSSINEDHTEGDISVMGSRLAQEVNHHIAEWCPGSTLGRISFIAHSLGGLIVRAALPLLEEHASKMYTFFSLSSPHLGYMYNSSKLVDAGLWVLKKWRRSQCLRQLSMDDHKDLSQTFIYKLSEGRGLAWFSNIVLVSSAQDGYVPFDSARIEIGSKAENDPRFGAAYIKMARALWSQIPPEAVYRFDVNFKIPERNLDTLTGRAAHIQFLENQPLMKMFIHTYRHLFE
eukprot:GILI01013284.1.p1 GENE.GILI01013284.1~~GILI01013284.1.p1  ORF type:complete len:369 (+),score=101.19 GILI01013284.1:46-1107(+)